MRERKSPFCSFSRACDKVRQHALYPPEMLTSSLLWWYSVVITHMVERRLVSHSTTIGAEVSRSKVRLMSGGAGI